MKRPGIAWGLHLIFWGVTSWFILSTFAIVSQEIEIVNDQETVRTVWSGNLVQLLIVLLLLCAALFYFNLWNVLRLAGSSRWRVFLTSVVALALSLSVYELILQIPPFTSFPRLHYGLVFGINLFYLAVSYGYGISKVWWRTESDRQQLELEKKQAQLDLLRSQLQPHFLFNVLNNLLSMVDQQQHPNLADAIDRLSGLLRHVVYDSAQDRIPVEKEITFIRNYAELQLLRFEAGEVNFVLTVDGDQLYLIEPGIFLPFIENAFKHGAAPEVQSSIQVHFDLTSAAQLLFSVRNSVVGHAAAPGKSGTGLAATRARLQLVYPGRHELNIEENGAFQVTLKLQNE